MMAKVRRKKAVSKPKVVSKPTAEVKCAYCKGTGRDPWGLMSVLAACQVCTGKGTVNIEEPYITCPVCKGRGNQRNTRLTCLACKGKGAVHVEKGMNSCPECDGTGMTGSVGLRNYCLKCHGTGRVSA
ncbi:hypothetical protein MYX78_01885 [Acidobacteria bacterium AH-259-G07]|nr:hypothetical protein [Acidobacteria bacterium AH-259-G07]